MNFSYLIISIQIAPRFSEKDFNQYKKLSFLPTLIRTCSPLSSLYPWAWCYTHILLLLRIAYPGKQTPRAKIGFRRFIRESSWVNTYARKTKKGSRIEQREKLSSVSVEAYSLPQRKFWKGPLEILWVAQDTGPAVNASLALAAQGGARVGTAVHFIRVVSKRAAATGCLLAALQGARD